MSTGPARPVARVERTTKASQSGAAPERGPGVGAQERRRLAECCAFFKAEQYREAEPGSIRKRDIEVAEAEIETVLKSLGK